ncbi:hypothetical protein C8R44DRAFT_888736 [Mycena epipterygia]|nr:hypothetical protein C8R44DRAFT_888736 [Mycena epipterygia]
MADAPSRSASPQILDNQEATGPAPAMETSPTEERSDTQKLIDAIDGLQKSTKDQADSLKAALDRLTAVEAQKGSPESGDKKTKFWMVYNKLADEFDKEFKEKYGDDLDNSLIFAGLFSAVASAFIILIQPEFQLDPNATTEMLLMLLVQNITGSAVPGMQTPPQTEPRALVRVAQSLLYLSLFSTLFAALLAVLGKQWIMYYNSAGERGTIAERGLERQRKFDALERWRFGLIMQISPLLLQFSLLLFAMALSTYLQTINHTLATISITLTSLGFLVYTLMVLSALVWSDSPFQTSLTNFLLAAFKNSRFHRLFKTLLEKLPFWEALQEWFASVPHNISCAWDSCSGFMKTLPPLLPLFNHGNSSASASPKPTPIFTDLPPPSEEVAAIVWVLETSTDPRLVEVAAAAATDLQWWPVSRDLQNPLKRLSDTFNGCFNGDYIRDGMADRATSCIQVFSLLEMVNKGQSEGGTLKPNVWYSDPSQELATLTTFLQKHDEIPFYLTKCVIGQWALRSFSAGQFFEEHLEWLLENFQPDEASLCNLSILADFLFCINSFFTHPSVQDLSLMDKR